MPEITGTSLRITAANGRTLTFVDGLLEVLTEGGRLRFGEGAGNELAVRSLIADAAKLRLEALGAAASCVSFNSVRPDGVAEEYLLVEAQAAEDAPGSLGGQLKLFCRQKDRNGDAAMALVCVVSVAYTADGLPVVRFSAPPQETLGPFAPPAPADGIPTALTVQANLAGSLAAIRAIGDGQWLTAVNANLDVVCEAVVPVSTQAAVRIELRRTRLAGTAPYVYVTVDGARQVSGFRPSGPAEVVTVPLVGGAGQRRVRLTASAQDGTVEIGAIVAQ